MRIFMLRPVKNIFPNEIEQFQHAEKFPLYVHEYFQQQARAFKDHTAVVFHHEDGTKEQMSYGELDEKSSQLALSIRKQGVDFQAPIGVSLSRGMNLVIAILAILKAECIVVTMETTECEQLRQKLGHCHFVLTDHQTKHLFSNTKKTLNIEEEKFALASSDSQFKSCLQPKDLAYIMYTSGTTSGISKGVALTHEGFANLLQAQQDQKLKPNSKIICTALPTFDAFLYDLLVAFVSHGEIHLTPEALRYSPDVLNKIIRDENINIGVFLPDLLRKLDADLPLDYVICMGASPQEKTLKLWSKTNPQRRVINGFGHTETGICLSLYPYNPHEKSTLIGMPVRNMEIIILNEELSLCAPGVPGEIYVTGPQIAAGYLNNPELTQAKFPVLYFDEEKQCFKKCDPSTPQARTCYATGDMAAYEYTDTKTLAINFLGRKDRQLKINGVRVEVEVVETILREIDSISDIILLPIFKKDNTPIALAAYIIPKNNVFDEQNKKEIFNAIVERLKKTSLPRVAYPQSLMLLQQFPLTKNGKNDLRALPAVAIDALALQKLTPLQTKLTQLIAKVSGRQQEEIDITASFAELGINSMQRTSLTNKIIKEFKFDAINSQQLRLSDSMTIIMLEKKLNYLLKQQKQSIYGQDQKITIYSESAINSPISSGAEKKIESPSKRIN